MKNIYRRKLLKDSMVKTIIEINQSKHHDGFFNIGYGSDSDFLYGVGVSVSSIIMNNPNVKIHFHIFVDVLSDKNIALFKALITPTENKLTFYIIDDSEFSSLPLPSQAWNKSIYYRLLIIHYLEKHTDKLLYLDADIICNGAIDELFDLEFGEDIYLYAVNDIFHLNGDDLNNNYFNSGFLYLSTELFMANNIPEKAIYLASENSYTHPDQDALNNLLNTKFSPLNEMYNYIFSFDSHISSKNTYRTIPDDAIFIHYVGVTKPFFKWATYYDEFKFFERARMQSPWKNEPLLNEKTYKQLSRKKTHLRKNGEYIDFILTIFKYVLRIFLNKNADK